MVLAIRQKYIEHIYNCRSCTNFWYLMSISSLLVPPSSEIRVGSLAGEATERRVASSNVVSGVMMGCLGVYCLVESSLLLGLSWL